MASFIDTVLALNPVFFGVKELAGPTIVNLAGGVNGAYDPTAVFGLQSPIETDTSIFSVGGVVGLVPAPNGSATDLLGNQTWIGWGYYDDTLAATAHLLGRRQQFGQSHGVQTGFNGGVITTHMTLDDGGGGAFYSLNDPILPLNGNWYMLSTVLNKPVLNLFTNDRLANTRSDLIMSNVYLGGVPNLPWWIGRSENSAAFPGIRTCMVALFDYALSHEQIITVYESALLALFINGRSDANPTAIIRSDFEPDPVSYPWRHNWMQPLIERISFRSAVSQSTTGIEEAAGERLIPRRELELTQVLKSQTERRKLRAMLWANQHAKWFIPIRQYAERLLEPLSSGATVTPITTTYKDYEDGGYIGFRQVDGDGNVEHWEERLITALNINSVEHEALVNDYVAHRSSVYPVRRALLPPSLSIKGHTDMVEELTVTARLLPEDEALTPNRITRFSPSIKYRDEEVFDGQAWQSNDWSEQREYEVERILEPLDFETGLIGAESDTPGAAETFSYRMVISGHENIAAFLGWFYERRGVLARLWVPTMQVDFEVISRHVFENQITVRDTNYSDSYALAEARRDLAFVYWDGSMEFRKVIAFEGTVNETLTLDAALPTFTNLRFVSLLKFCRLDADQLELAWETDNTIVVAWRFRELLHTPEGTGASSLSPSASLSGSVSPSSSASPSGSVSPSLSSSSSPSPSGSISPSSSLSPSSSPSATLSPSSSASRSPSPSSSASSSVSRSPSASQSPSSSISPST